MRGLAAAAAFASAIAMGGVAAASPSSGGSSPASSANVDLGPNVIIFDPSMPQATIQAKVDAIANQQVSNQFGTQRYALLFEPGTYGSAADPLVFQVGYYTEVAGLGASPSDVVINGKIDVYNQCFGPVDPTATFPEASQGTNCIALDNFWRSLSNLTINPMGGSGCQAANEFWAVSQAAPMRRVQVNGFTTFMDYCGDTNYASGGFVADSALNGGALNGSQQQFFTRNSSVAFWTNAVWNQVFAGVIGAPAQSFPNPPYTTLDTNPVSRERPFLTVDANGNYSVYVPDAQTNGRGTTWANGQTPGHSISLSDFFVATPSSSVQQINNALSRGENLLLTPGVYQVDQTIKVKRADTIVLGLGFATIEPMDGVVPMTVADVPGVDIAGLMFDAGPVNSPVLLQIGKADGNNHNSNPADPTGLQDVFFRIGGAHVGKATVSLEVNSDNVIIDDTWAWRADHGQGVGWTSNTADTGLLVNGDNVTATGLFVEHYQKQEVLWNGNGGRDIFFQNELPYDPPSQDAWNVSSDQLGYPAFTVSPNVQTFNGYGMGSYVVFIQTDATIWDDMAFQSPTRPGVQFHDIFSLYISANNGGGDKSVINGVGGSATAANPDVVVPVVSYP